MLTYTRVTFHNMDEEMMRKLTVALIHPRMEHGAVVWSTHKKRHVKIFEGVQRTATKTINEPGRLITQRKTGRVVLPWLKERRERRHDSSV